MAISKIIKNAVWERDHDTIRAMCPCCEITEMTVHTCVCAHKTASARGGDQMKWTILYLHVLGVIVQWVQ